MIQIKGFHRVISFLGIIFVVWTANRFQKSWTYETLGNPSQLIGQITPDLGALEPDRAIKYSEAIVEEIKLSDLINQIKRGIFYAKKAGIATSSLQEKFKNLQSILQEIRRALRLYELKGEHSINPSPPFLVPTSPSPFGEPPGSPLPKPSMGSERTVALGEIDFNALSSLLEKGDALAKAILQQLQLDLKKKFNWFIPIKPNYGSVKNNKGRDQIFNHITFGIRISDFGGDIYRNLWDWNIIKPISFDLIFPHPHLYGELYPSPKKFDFKNLDEVIQVNRSHGFNTMIDIEARVPVWLMQTYGESLKLTDPVHSELFWHNAKGETARSVADHSTANIWHPEVRKSMIEYIEKLGEKYQYDSWLAIIGLYGEYQVETKNEEPAGYSRVAKEAFRKYIKEKYGSIDELNKKYYTSFKDFSKIEPPESLFPTGDEKLTPRLYDFEIFRQESLVKFFAETIEKLRKHAPNRLICSGFLGFFNGPLPGIIKFPGLNFLKLASLDWDILGKHDQVELTFTDARVPDINSLYTYSINRYVNHTLWNDQHWWAGWEATRTTNEFVVKTVTERNIWRQIAWGKRGLNFFTLDQNFAGLWNDNLLNLPGKQTIRYPVSVIPLIKKKLQQIEGILFNSEISSQYIGILQPSTSIIVAAPAWTTTNNAIKIAKWLLNGYYIPFFIPEEVIISGKEDLKDIKLLIVPYATHAPDGLVEKLLSWVKEGGTILSLGPLGVYNQYGNQTNNFIPTIFGLKDQDLRYVAKGWKSWSGLLGKEVGYPDGEWKVKSLEDKILIKNYGTGKAILWIGTELYQRDLERLIKVINNTLLPLRQIKVGVTNRKVIYDLPFQTPDNQYDLEIVPLDTPQGERYLFVINLDVAKEIEVEISIKGKYERIADLTIDAGMPIYSAFSSGWTTFAVPLDPGQGLFFKLEKNEN